MQLTHSRPLLNAFNPARLLLAAVIGVVLQVVYDSIAQPYVKVACGCCVDWLLSQIDLWFATDGLPTTQHTGSAL